MSAHDRKHPPVFYFNDAATTEIYTLSLHDALPISAGASAGGQLRPVSAAHAPEPDLHAGDDDRSEEHTSELQSRQYLVCRLLLEKKNLITGGFAGAFRTRSQLSNSGIAFASSNENS